MNESQAAAVDLIMKTLVDLPWDDRKEVIDAVRYNDKFCWYCGSNDTNCQCWNDE